MPTRSVRSLRALEARIRDREPRRPAVAPQFGRAAVAIVFRPGPDLLFIQRSERAGDPWSGHMAFPGGRVDPGDAGARGAAERETREEVGLDLAHSAEFIGALDEIVTPPQASRRQLLISPFVYALDRDPSLRPNNEVAAVHWFSLDRLVAGEGRSTRRWVGMGLDILLPAVYLDGTEIWGITLRMLDDLLALAGADPV